jgi:hypothetical protein
MAKGFAMHARAGMVAGLLLLTAGCSKSNDQPEPFDGQDSTPQSFPLSAALLKNCRFETPNPTYTYGQAIRSNPVICDEGAVRSVSVLNTNPLPSGLSFSTGQMSLVGTASERIPTTAYQFYLENEAGYAILKMQLTVK